MEDLKLEKTINQLFALIEESFRGILIIKTKHNLKWSFYLRLGHCSWVTGGNDAHGRFQRNLALFCPQITPVELKKITPEYTPYQHKSILVKLQEESIISEQQIAKMMTNMAIEVLFDLIQYYETVGDTLCYDLVPQNNDYYPCLLLPVIDFKSIVAQAKEAWCEWKNARLTKYSPNLFPIIKQPILLHKQVTKEKEKQIISLINGKQTIRTIALRSQVKTLTLTRFLVALANSGAIGFSRMPYQKPPQPSVRNKLAKTSPLVMCVDDSPLIVKAVEKIVTNHNYRYISIQESMKVMPLVLRNKPDFIFLDLMMPVVNGYELCAKLRKAPSLKDVPIVILTGKDGLVDRMRAKLVGSTDFMAKPVEESAVLSMLDKHLGVEKQVFVRN